MAPLSVDKVSVARQVGETGIRMAPCGQRGAVVWIVRGVLTMTAVGHQLACRVERVPACQIVSVRDPSPMTREPWCSPASSS